MKIYLPDDIRSGETISGTVVLEPEGLTEKIKNRNKAALQKYALSYTEANGSVKSLSTHFTILINQNNATIHVNDGNKLISNYSIPIQKEDYKISSFVFPSHVLTQSPFRIHGPFDGNTSNTVPDKWNRNRNTGRIAKTVHNADASGRKQTACCFYIRKWKGNSKVNICR
jgi:hypothetical protein